MGGGPKGWRRPLGVGRDGAKLSGLGRGGAAYITTATTIASPMRPWGLPGQLKRGMVGSAALSGRGGAAGGRGQARNPRKRANAPGYRSDGKTEVELQLTAARGQEDVVRLLDKARPSAKQLNMLIKQMGREKQKLDWLWAWAEKQTGLLDLFHYNAYITQLGRRKRWEDALALYARMQAAGFKADVVTYSALISACEKGAQWGRAVEVFEEMKAAGVKPDAIIYTALISTCEKGKQWDLAKEVSDEMKAAGVPDGGA
jgi:pentatricopeptide repeat protein